MISRAESCSSKISFMRVEAAGTLLLPPDGTWDLIFIRSRSGVRAIRTGLSTKAVRLHHDGTEEILTISFDPSVKLVHVNAVASLDRGYVLAGDERRFELAGETFEIPSADNADVLVERLYRRGLLGCNAVVRAVLAGERLDASARTLQRQFKLTTGMTFKHFTMVERARRAAESLSRGEAAQDVSHRLGFYDQAHLVNSVRGIIGLTPSQLHRSTRDGIFQYTGDRAP